MVLDWISLVLSTKSYALCSFQDHHSTKHVGSSGGDSRFVGKRHSHLFVPRGCPSTPGVRAILTIPRIMSVMACVLLNKLVLFSTYIISLVMRLICFLRRTLLLQQSM